MAVKTYFMLGSATLLSYTNIGCFSSYWAGSTGGARRNAARQ